MNLEQKKPDLKVGDIVRIQLQDWSQARWPGHRDQVGYIKEERAAGLWLVAFCDDKDGPVGWNYDEGVIVPLRLGDNLRLKTPDGWVSRKFHRGFDTTVSVHPAIQLRRRVPGDSTTSVLPFHAWSGLRVDATWASESVGAEASLSDPPYDAARDISKVAPQVDITGRVLYETPDRVEQLAKTIFLSDSRVQEFAKLRAEVIEGSRWPRIAKSYLIFGKMWQRDEGGWKSEALKRADEMTSARNLLGAVPWKSDGT